MRPRPSSRASRSPCRRAPLRALERLVGELAPVSPVVALAIREPPFPSIPTSVAAVHASYQLRCSADGMMYQQAICRAASRLRLAVQLCKRGEESARAAEQLGVTPGDVEDFVARSGRPAGPPWTEEHRRAFAAGIAALAPHVRGRLSLESRELKRLRFGLAERGRRHASSRARARGSAACHRGSTQGTSVSRPARTEAAPFILAECLHAVESCWACC